MRTAASRFRPVTIVDAGVRRPIQLSVEVPIEDMSRIGEVIDVASGPASATRRTSIWSAIHPRLVELIRAHTSTLIFVNARRLAERLATRLNELAAEEAEREAGGTPADGAARFVSAEAVGAPPAVYALFEETLDTLRHSYGREHLLIAALATGHLLGQLLALHRRRPAAASARERIDQTIQFVRARLGARISVPELARLANLSCSHFAATFKRQTGYAVLEYFMRLRMQKAAHLLDTTALPVKAVAATVGYDDPLYFSRLFRRIYDLSPARYRQIKKG